MGGKKTYLCLFAWFGCSMILNIPVHLCLVLYENLQNIDVWEMKFSSQIKRVLMVGIEVYLFLYAQSISHRTNTVLTWMAVIFDQSLVKHHAYVNAHFILRDLPFPEWRKKLWIIWQYGNESSQISFQNKWAGKYIRNCSINVKTSYMVTIM